jgi:ABC-type amino acid transport substrate-binding protein
MKKFVPRWAAILGAPALLLLAAPAGMAAEPQAEIPVFVAEQTDANGQPAPGLLTMTGVVQLLAAESGLKLVVHAYPWRRAQMKAKNGEGLLFGATETAERAAMFKFTKPLYMVNQWLVTPAQRPVDFKGWDDLRGKIISIPSGARFDADFEAHRGQTFQVEENASTVGSRFKMMESGRVDVLMIDSYRGAAQLEALINCKYPATLKWAVMARPVGAEAAEIAVPIASAWMRYVPALNDAIERMGKARSVQKYLDQRSVTTDGC